MNMGRLLYICAWRGYTKTAKLLLHFGTDANIVTNGGSLIYTVCKAQYHHELLDFLKNNACTVSDNLLKLHLSLQTLGNIMQNANIDSKMKLRTLLPISSDHPGAGACIIYDAF
mmetsp:Transcript_22963/g.34830  ORF Transcript_22963/g.34830 Transcript_22963/m.34830 type:complete len:114 (+) Transcript_22963:84-425(+)